MCGEFGEVTVIIGLVINFLAFVPPFVSFRDTLTYACTGVLHNYYHYILSIGTTGTILFMPHTSCHKIIWPDTLRTCFKVSTIHRLMPEVELQRAS